MCFGSSGNGQHVAWGIVFLTSMGSNCATENWGENVAFGKTQEWI